MTHLSNENQRTTWLGAMAVWFSGISMLVYFCFSDAVRHYFIFITKAFSKTLQVILK